MNPDNLMAFKEFVLNNTDGKGVHFVMGDGVSSCDLTELILLEGKGREGEEEEEEKDGWMD